MPTTYAHDAFGKTVYLKLQKEMKDLIGEHKAAFCAGLQGPDILFYYKPFQQNQVNQQGHRMHSEEAYAFFSKCKSRYLETESETLLSYILGFICHYMLDSACHPFISGYMQKYGVGHDEIETEFDRTLMEHVGRNPYRYHPSDPVRPEKSLAKEIAGVLEPVTEAEIQKCLKSMKFYTNRMVCSGKVKRKALLHILKLVGAYESMQGHIMRKKRDRRCEESTEELILLFRLAVPETVTVLEDFYKTIQETDYLNYRFLRTYE